MPRAKRPMAFNSPGLFGPILTIARDKTLTETHFFTGTKRPFNHSHYLPATYLLVSLYSLLYEFGLRIIKQNTLYMMFGKVLSDLKIAFIAAEICCINI